jgi:hypothetical protein
VLVCTEHYYIPEPHASVYPFVDVITGTRIAEGAKTGPNFAEHYTIVTIIW